MKIELLIPKKNIDTFLKHFKAIIGGKINTNENGELINVSFELPIDSLATQYLYSLGFNVAMDICTEIIKKQA